MTTNETPAAPANVAPAVWARYLRAAVAARTAETIERRADAAYEASYVAQQVGIDEAAVEPLVIAEVARLEAPVEVKVVDGEPVLDRATPAPRLTDRALWVQFMMEDRALAGYDNDPNEPDDDRHGALIAEILERFGADATELTADYSVATHMSSDDLVRWALEQYPHLVGIATGAIVPAWRREDGEPEPGGDQREREWLAYVDELTELGGRPSVHGFEAYLRARRQAADEAFARVIRGNA